MRAVRSKKLVWEHAAQSLCIAPDLSDPNVNHHVTGACLGDVLPDHIADVYLITEYRSQSHISRYSVWRKNIERCAHICVVLLTNSQAFCKGVSHDSFWLASCYHFTPEKSCVLCTHARYTNITPPMLLASISGTMNTPFLS